MDTTRICPTADRPQRLDQLPIVTADMSWLEEHQRDLGLLPVAQDCLQEFAPALAIVSSDLGQLQAELAQLRADLVPVIAFVTELAQIKQSAKGQGPLAIMRLLAGGS